MRTLSTFSLTFLINFILLPSVIVSRSLNVENINKVTHTNSTSIQKLGSRNEIPNSSETEAISKITIEKTCTIGNRVKRYVLNGSRWRDTNLTYKINNYPKRLKKEDVDVEISKAFDIWSQHSALSFQAKVNGSVHIEINFDKVENGDPFDGPGKVVARSYFPNAGGDVYFDIAEHWTIGKRTGINLFQAAAHEIGHSLGLSHSKNKLALMAPMYKGFDPKFKLHEDDILAIQELYGKKKERR